MVITTGRINLKHMRAFRAVAHHAHFTRAADAIGVSQPALSALIAQLEEDLGVTLFNRTTRAVELTPVGREFLAAALRVLAEFEAAVGEVRDYARLRRGRLRIAALPSLTRTLLPRALSTFRERHPDIAVSVIDLPGDRLLERMDAGEVDLGLGYAEPSAQLHAEPLLSDQLIAAMRAGTLPADRHDLPWSELAEHPVIAMNHGTTVRRAMDYGAQAAGVELRIVLESQQMPTAIAYAGAGLGIAVLPATALAPGEEPEIVRLPITCPVVDRHLSIISRAHQVPTPAAQAFSQILLETIAARPELPAPQPVD